MVGAVAGAVGGADDHARRGRSTNTKSRRAGVTKHFSPSTAARKKIGSGPLTLRGPTTLARRNVTQSTPENWT